MRKIAQTSALLVYLDELEYTEAALASWEETKAVAGPYVEAIAGFEAVFRKEREARRGVTRAEAVAVSRNARLDGTTTRFGGQVLAEAGQDRSSALFRRFFPEAPSAFVRRPLREQVERTLGVMLAELEKLDAKGPLAAFGAPLKDAAEQAIAALDARARAKAERAVVVAEVDDWKASVNTLRLTTYGELLRIAAEKGYGRDWADLFFRTASRTRSPEAGLDGVEAPATAGA